VEGREKVEKEEEEKRTETVKGMQKNRPMFMRRF
jgi:hypothetical protein